MNASLPALLQNLSSTNFSTGTELAEKLSVSRATINGWVKQLVELGVDVHSVKGKGYRLSEPADLLDKVEFARQLSEECPLEASLCDFEWEVDSTNKRALTHTRLLNKWHLYSCEYQTAGRGRRGRQWQSGLASNLMFSLAKKTNWSPTELSSAPLITGLAIAQVLTQIGVAGVSVKWPNDIYIHGEKVAGVLCELQGSPQDDALLVVGVGINVQQAPAVAEQKVTSLASHQCELNRTELLAKVVEQILNSFRRAGQFGLQSVMDAWPRYDFLKDKPIKVNRGEHWQEGIARGINEQGQLVVETEKGALEPLSGGEVTVRWI